jgi:excisionase family DNA binding protein
MASTAELNQKRLIRPAEAFDLLGVGHTKGYDLLKTGAIPVVRLGGTLRIPLGALEQWIEQNTQLAPRPEAK